MTDPRCTGHCCRSFPLNHTIEQLRAYAADTSKGNASEAGQIADMLIPLGARDDGREMFTCRHHDTETGDCRIYEDRPRMCRDYPYGRSCEHSECTAVDLVQLRIEREPEVLAAEVAAEMAMERCKPMMAPEHRPGARRPGYKSTPPVPRWARERKSGAPQQSARARR